MNRYGYRDTRDRSLDRPAPDFPARSTSLQRNRSLDRERDFPLVSLGMKSLADTEVSDLEADLR